MIQRSLKPSPFAALLVLGTASLLISSSSTFAARAGDRDSLARLISQIQKADYEGDRVALHRLYDELTPLAIKSDWAAHTQYWRGFALWRSAINGFNDNTEKKELAQDLNLAIEAFDKSLAADPSFVESKIGETSCLSTLAYVLESSSPEQQDHIARSRLTLKEAMSAAPDNPRLLWVLGPVYWNIPAEHGGGQNKAIESYEKGLLSIRSNKRSAVSDPLDPSWGEPELLMSLAWSYLNRAKPDLGAAEQSAAAALRLVPNWHYVRDILMRQIQEAKSKESGKG